jgi:hypothetical protein
MQTWSRKNDCTSGSGDSNSGTLTGMSSSPFATSCFSDSATTFAFLAGGWSDSAFAFVKYVNMQVQMIERTPRSPKVVANPDDP